MARASTESTHVLPDVLAPDLRVVFCGTAPGTRSAVEQAYYAHPGNQFWPALHAAGLTPRLFAPAEFRGLLSLGLGLTDVAKHHSGNDDALPRDAFDADALRSKVVRYAPRVLAFTSKAAARAVLGRVDAYGEQAERLGATRIVVLPSPSGQARGHWSMEPWMALGALVRTMRD
ncbi:MULTISPECIES: mismatch-specific DNA-glycosylase [Dyella]|uniref:Mismatch-specific DNA-glycosylase n=2 Tax=Dyella TaxID=231454 RepID=A0A4R0Z5J3_9GAMM|nr:MULTISPECIES: mismatch-specific DNA-glycosylase [Dyella]TBR38709.1 mismatch-specific DNA-glycosylase [Dyella terrae]TCI13700.1 mismatch-specific DNA-glycosylase [Dyella soli]